MAEDAAAAEPPEVASGEVDGVDGAAAAIAAAEPAAEPPAGAPAAAEPPAISEPPEEEDASAEWRDGATQGDHLMAAKAKRQSPPSGGRALRRAVTPLGAGVLLLRRLGNCGRLGGGRRGRRRLGCWLRRRNGRGGAVHAVDLVSHSMRWNGSTV